MNISKNLYTKIKLAKFGKTTVNLIKWPPACKTPIHYHPNTTCNFYLLKGTLIESGFKRFPEIDNILINIYNNKLDSFLSESYIDDSLGAHSIQNICDKTNAYSLHIYKELQR